MAGGNYVWDLYFTLGTKGLRDIQVFAGYGGAAPTGWNFEVLMVGSSVVALNSAAPAKFTVAVNEYVKVTITSTKGVEKIGFFSETGASIGKINQTKTTVGDVVTWTAEIKIGTKGLRTITVKGAGADGVWIEPGLSFPLAVNPA